MEISWTITAKQQRSKIWSLFFFVFITLSLGAVMLNALLVVLPLVIVYFVLKMIFVWGDKTYKLNDEGVTLSHSLGKRIMQYRWDEFDTFALFSERLERNMQKRNTRIGTSEVLEKSDQYLAAASGEIYLHKRSRSWGIAKTFVVLEINTENTAPVLSFLSTKLQRVKMTNTSDLGMVRYER